MEERLWTPKKDYIVFDPAIHLITETCGNDMESFIPYQRCYNTLDPRQLCRLISDARKNKWQALDLTNCGLFELPDELWDLPDLRMLYLGNQGRFLSSERFSNHFSFIPRKIERLVNLQVLYLRRLPLRFEGGTPWNLKRLVHLDIFSCFLPAYPGELLIPSLEAFGASGFTAPLPGSFSSMTNLRSIYLHECRFQKLPESLGFLQKLETLSLVKSNVATLPHSVRHLRNLRRLVLDHTPLADTIPPEILRQSPREVIRYILDQQGNAPRESFNESKMIIVGQAQVGKSSLMERLVYDRCTAKDSTEGIRIEPWFFDHGGEEYRLNIWDFGGQEIYHATHQFFLTRRALYVLVWDALAEDEYGRIDYWLRTIQSFADDSPILIVVNKCDADAKRRKRIYLEEYQPNYPQIRDIYEVSCRDDLCISRLREDIKGYAAALPLMKTSWKSAWLRVRQTLEDLVRSRNHISYQEYLDICREEAIDGDEALSLAKFLHDLGVVLYYHDDTLLKNMVILSPEWGTDAVYRVLDHQERQLRGRNGILRTDTDLDVIWDDRDRYPPEYHQHLLNLMEKFQLAFRVTPSTYLVAELLENRAIVLDRPFAHGQTLHFRYQYDFLPAGVMTRFIVDIHEYLETIGGVKQCWRKGAYLQNDSAYALVRLYDRLDQRYVQIQVSGPDPRSRQDLLTIIRKSLDRVNSMFSKITITRQVLCTCSEGCTFTFDYEILLAFERQGTPIVQCLRTGKFVPIKKLLDGVENTMENDFFAPHITVSPTFHNEVKPEIIIDAQSTATATNTVTVTVEIRDLINGLQGDFNDLKGEVDAPSEDFTAQCGKVQTALNALDSSKTKEEITKSGAMNKIKRFLEECHDPESETGKLIAGVKYAAGIVRSLAQKYNKIAKWLALPLLPFVDE